MDTGDAPEKKVRLVSSDGNSFVLDEEVAMQSETIKNMMKAGFADPASIPLPMVSTKVLAKVVEFLNKHVKMEKQVISASDYDANSDVKAGDTDFVDVDDKVFLLGLNAAARYLNIKDLIDLTTKSISSVIVDKSPYEINKIFDI